MTDRCFSSAAERWAGLGPYYAMFPMSFACEVIKRYSPTGGTVLDPFAGRGTSVYAAGWHGRRGLGVELNPVGWLYARAKLRPAHKWDVTARLTDIYHLSFREQEQATPDLPEFFRICFCSAVLKFLVAARRHLKWATNRTDATLMALILQDLHGNRGRAMSNQMRQTKSMSPAYAIRWWRERRLRAPDINPEQFLRKKIEWRYKHGANYFANCKVLLGDSTKRLCSQSYMRGQVDLLLTSPPYMGITDYHYDQWMRLWVLGGEPSPRHLHPTSSRGDFDNESHYSNLLQCVFENCAPLLRRGAAVYVRTDARERTLHVTHDVLKVVFGAKAVNKARSPFVGRTQTALFGDTAPKPGEVDICFTV